MRTLYVFLALIVTIVALRLKMEDQMAMSHLTGMNRPDISDDEYNRYLAELSSQLFKRSPYRNNLMNNGGD
ncbi:hypothetical protein V3C99_014687 [Haemonchus contortus]|uniref:Uncharacterized protein n=1 Tax=Haemonchus contortus TaxID=6289 RepID=A0A7I5ECH7_HAECO